SSCKCSSQYSVRAPAQLFHDMSELSSLLYHFLIHHSPLFFFNDTPTTEIYTLSLHDALPISSPEVARKPLLMAWAWPRSGSETQDRKSTRLNSSHEWISYAVFCLKKKKKTNNKTNKQHNARMKRPATLSRR